MTMDELKPGQSAYVKEVGGTGALRHHLLDMGITPGTDNAENCTDGGPGADGSKRI